jgi:hypothetical protein
MTSIVALGAVTVGINLTTSHAELPELGLTPGSDSTISVDRMEQLRLALEHNRGRLPDPRSGGSISNTAVLLARAGVSCGMMGVLVETTHSAELLSRIAKGPHLSSSPNSKMELLRVMTSILTMTMVCALSSGLLVQTPC